MTYIYDEQNKTNTKMCWTEDNRMQAYVQMNEGTGRGRAADYSYNSVGERYACGVEKKLRNIAMNSKRENNRSRIHEVFHTLFFDNDNANSGIGSYTCDDMPNQADINMLINNDRLPKIENVE